MTTRNQLDQLRREIAIRRGGTGIVGMSERMRKRKATSRITPASPTREYYEAVMGRTNAGTLAHVMARRGLFRLEHEFVADPDGGDNSGRWMPRQATGD